MQGLNVSFAAHRHRQWRVIDPGIEPHTCRMPFKSVNHYAIASAKILDIDLFLIIDLLLLLVSEFV